MGAQAEGVKAVRSVLDLIGFPGGEYWKRPDARSVVGNAVKVLHRFQEYGLLADVAREYRTRFEGLAPGALAEASMAEGIALAYTGRHAEAEPLLRSALGRGTNAANADEVAFSLGLSLLKQGKVEEARSTLANLLAGSPHFPRAYYQLGMAFPASARRTRRKPCSQRRAISRRARGDGSRPRALRGGRAGTRRRSPGLGYSLRDSRRKRRSPSRTGSRDGTPSALAALYIDSSRGRHGEVLARTSRLVGSSPGRDRAALAASSSGATPPAPSMGSSARAEAPAGSPD
jgi:tetratricopeptide (TPR) repeat protein